MTVLLGRGDGTFAPAASLPAPAHLDFLAAGDFDRDGRDELVVPRPQSSEVTVYRFDQVWRRGDRACFEIECSSGTYVRSLIVDLGDAYTESLRRTRIGPFSVEEAEAFLSLDAAIARLEGRRP